MGETHQARVPVCHDVHLTQKPMGCTHPTLAINKFNLHYITNIMPHPVPDFPYAPTHQYFSHEQAPAPQS